MAVVGDRWHSDVDVSESSNMEKGIDQSYKIEQDANDTNFDVISRFAL